MTKFSIEDLFFYKYCNMIVRNGFYPRDVKFQYPESLNQYTQRYKDNVIVELQNVASYLKFKLIKENWQIVTEEHKKVSVI